MSIRVAIADDHRVVRVGLEQLLATFDDVTLVGSASGGEEAVALCTAEGPDVLLLDLSMPDLDGVEVTRRLADARSATRVVVFTSFSDRERIVQALDPGRSATSSRTRSPRRSIPRSGRRPAERPR